MTSIDLDTALAQHIGEKAAEALANYLNPDFDKPAVYVWPRDGRAVLVIDPKAVTNLDRVLYGRFAERLSALLDGRRVIKSANRLIFQVAYTRPEQASELVSAPLDLLQQPTPVSVPIGMTKRGPLWVSLPEMDSVLIGGARRMGKSRFVHGWIAALLHGGQARLTLWDGKQGQEFGRYASNPNVSTGDDLVALLTDITAETVKRRDLYKPLGVTSLPEYNERAAAKLPILVVIVDEAAFVEKQEGAWEMLHDLIARCGAYGVHPVIATQYPTVGAVAGNVKANLPTRISLPVAGHVESQVILGRTGAEKIPKKPGRLIFSHSARLIHAQAFDISLEQQQSAQDNSQVREIVARSRDTGGRVTIAQVGEWLGITAHQARTLLEEMQAAGWLEKQEGERGARTVTKAAYATFTQ